MLEPCRRPEPPKRASCCGVHCTETRCFFQMSGEMPKVSRIIAGSPADVSLLQEVHRDCKPLTPDGRMRGHACSFSLVHDEDV